LFARLPEGGQTAPILYIGGALPGRSEHADGCCIKPYEKGKFRILHTFRNQRKVILVKILVSNNGLADITNEKKYISQDFTFALLTTEVAKYNAKCLKQVVFLRALREFSSRALR
jgi:hypothetical protein